MKNPNWLYEEYGRNITSQCGEDGVIEKIFDSIKPHNKWCVEFGALDGVTWSNTYNLIKNHGWKSIQIESKIKSFAKLQETYKDNKNVICIRKTVGLTGSSLLDFILYARGIPRNFDLLSIDVDGLDYGIFNTMKVYRPRVIIIECNEPLFWVTQLAKRKGYELVAVTGVNAIYVLKEYFFFFDIDNSVTNYKIWTEKRKFRFGLELLK